METIGSQQIHSFVDGVYSPQKLSNTAIRKGKGVLVRSYIELARQVATLQFLNRDYVLVFRGQGQDYKNRNGNTMLRPSIARGARGSFSYDSRFSALRQAENILVEEFRAAGFRGIQRLSRQRILRWSILQHYEVCKTPLLDVTHSLRIGASFASHSASSEAFVMVLGLPNLSGAVTASAEAGLQVVRLSSVCPPEAVRPHIQEGYLLGEYPDLDGVAQKSLYASYEIDFGLRLIGKFRFDPGSFWASSRDFPIVDYNALYPSVTNDPLRRIGEHISGLIPVV
jgi:hypothetical protein